MYYVYLLKSLVRDEFYVGSTSDLRRRFKEHNDGREISTKRYKPWKLVYYEAYTEEKYARQKEKMLKQHGNAIRQLKRRAGVLELPGSISRKGEESWVYPALISKKKYSAGFTMIEILVVFMLIGILMVSVLGNSFIGSRKRARDADRRAQLRNLTVVFEQFLNDYGVYPEADTNGLIHSCTNGGGNQNNQPCPWGSAFIDMNSTVYSARLPEDRIGGDRRFYYHTDNTRTKWQVYVYLEDDQSDDLDHDGDGIVEFPGDDEDMIPDYAICITSTNTKCNWGVSSGNTTIYEVL